MMRLSNPELWVVHWREGDRHRGRGYYMRHVFGVQEWHYMHTSPDAMVKCLSVQVEAMMYEMEKAGCPADQCVWEVQFPLTTFDE